MLKQILYTLIIIFIGGCSVFYSRSVVMYANDNDIDYETAKYRISIQADIAQLNLCGFYSPSLGTIK